MKSDKKEKKIDDLRNESVVFMIAEYDNLFRSWHHTDTIADGRLNLFITITSGTVGLFVLLSQFIEEPIVFWEISIVAFFFIWIIGLITHRRMLERNMVAVEYLRAFGRIRRFFYEIDNQILPYLSYPIIDSEPKYTRFGRAFGARTIAALLSSIIFGILIFFTSYFYNLNLTLQSNNGLILGAIGFVIHLIGLEALALRKLRKKEEEEGENVRFSE